jgi:predicted homoserine dehydrogenase-like protein
MNLQSMLAARIAADKPVRVGLIGAGKFGSMFLAQVPSIAGLDVAAISDLDPERAKAACRKPAPLPRVRRSKGQVFCF